VNPKKFQLVSLAILLSISLNSCFFFASAAIAKRKAKKELTVDNRAIPADFGKNKSTMLVVKTGKKSYDKYLIKNFEEYVGDYRIVSAEALDSAKYSNKTQFRYVFNFKFEAHIITGYDGSASTINVRRFSIQDRKDGILYQSPITSSYFGKVMKAYIENLNLEIENNR